jgi:very-short-patch-repair endonuclease
MLKVDLLNATKKIAVEIQGDQHESFNKFFHDNSRFKYLQSIKRDVKKEKWLEMNEFKFLQVYESDLKTLSPQYIEEKCGILII